MGLKVVHQDEFKLVKYNNLREIEINVNLISYLEEKLEAHYYYILNINNDICVYIYRYRWMTFTMTKTINLLSSLK